MVTDDTMRSAAQDIAVSLQQSRKDGRSIALYDSNGTEIYPVSGKISQQIQKLTSLSPRQVVYDIERNEKAYELTVTGLFTYGSDRVYLSYVQDVSQVFTQRKTQVHTFMTYQGVNILMSIALAFVISWLLTRPVRKLTQTSRKISAGNYGQRADVHSSDEIGELAQSFNIMATSVEEKINELEQTSQAKDDFIANFTHELKTPMTSIIGYADMLRSRQLEPAKAFKAAQYIYSEANRLETLSLKMLNLIMLEQQKFVFAPVNCPELVEYIAQVVTPSFEHSSIQLTVSAQEGFILAEQDLIKTLLINIVDNARKASKAGGSVDLLGFREDEHYTIIVTDHGRGIPQEEMSKVTEAFYMVDKSRSRIQNGVGLGLAIANRIASLHHTALQIHSNVGIGTCVSITLPCCQTREDENE